MKTDGNRPLHLRVLGQEWLPTLPGARRLVREGGTVLVLDERVPEEFTGPGDPVEQLMYGFSVLVRLPDGMTKTHSLARDEDQRSEACGVRQQQSGRDPRCIPRSRRRRPHPPLAGRRGSAVVTGRWT